MESEMLFCLVDAPHKDTVEKHHAKFGIKCGWQNYAHTFCDVLNQT